MVIAVDHIFHEPRPFESMRISFPIALSLLAWLATTLSAADLTIRRDGSAVIAPKSVRYQCDDNGCKPELPTGPFEVRYINRGANSLAVIPISEASLIFANINSGSGAGYAAGDYVRREAAGRMISLNLDRAAGRHMESVCQVVE